MPNYIVKSRLDHDGKPYKEGATVEMTKEQAKLASEAVEPANEQKEPDAPKK